MRNKLKIMVLLLSVGMMCISLSACTQTNKFEPVAGTELPKYSNNETWNTDTSTIGDGGQATIQKAEYAPSRSSTPTPIVKSIGKVIVIDPGHANRSNLELEANAPGSSVMKIKDGGGAVGIDTKTPEYLINMNVSLQLRDLLQKKGYTIVMTKTDNSVSLGNIQRAEIGNKEKAALVLRIHADSSENTTASGASMLVPLPVNDETKAIIDESNRCGRIILNSLTSEVGMKNRGLAPHNDMTGFNWSKVPVILVEMGFLSNPDEDRALSDANYQAKLAKALADGIAEALK
ncbi:N-acetylmuramoyl-L-alanine amidase [Desulfosporosinus fructosivorans]|uniref:N-acetylmuramoyl-L-alanine amidase n=1 Tax=Desulfosporosinus fructosivorans TaxID=2018669 RepID=A0A4Z0R3S3_9FIRM|nr:N-acetylmuramoyl-L-alanine amidase [Desulfosporosinus fructosivorans]TGE37224.1 N-acetylmuramoyl-L-alanine amidase [Desulfosporosinus fructosivorans]